MSIHCDPFWHQEDNCRDCQPKPAQQDPAPAHKCLLRDTIAECAAGLTTVWCAAIIAGWVVGAALVVYVAMVLL